MAKCLEAVAALLCAQIVFVFTTNVGQIQQEGQGIGRPFRRPVDVIVDVMETELDGDENGQVSLAEVEDFIYRWLSPRDEPPHVLNPRNLELKGYLMTVANLADVNGDGIIQRREIRRAAAMLLNNAGNTQIGRVLEIKFRKVSRLPPETRAAMAIGKFMAVADSNQDGEVNGDEMDSVFQGSKFRAFRYRMSDDVTTADLNQDGRLNEAESLQFLANIPRWVLRDMLIYVEMFRQLGSDIAIGWANTQ